MLDDMIQDAQNKDLIQFENPFYPNVKDTENALKVIGGKIGETYLPNILNMFFVKERWN